MTKSSEYDLLNKLINIANIMHMALIYCYQYISSAF